MDIIPDSARALFNMVQKRSENALSNLALSFAAAATPSATPSFGGGASSTTATAAPSLRSKTVKKTGTTMLKVSSNLDDYSDAEKKEAMKTANGGSITVRMQVERAQSLQSILGKGWNSKVDMGVDTDEELKDMHALALS
jgi:hypothetical protein